jgi:hypothetical protein
VEVTGTVSRVGRDNTGSVSLQPGDCILAFADGVTEAMDVNNIQLQTKRVYAELRVEAAG